MKVQLLVLLLAGFFSCQTTPAAEESKEVFLSGNRHILLMHPTVQNLKTFIYLAENNILPLPEDYLVVGVYHRSAAYNYALSEQFIEQEGLTNIRLKGLEPAIGEDELFSANPLSDAFRTLFENSEGVIFFGGPDIPPSVYGQQTNLLTVITDPHRHYHELSFLFHLLGGSQDITFQPFLDEKPDYRILGICLGMQTMNVATGGTMYQDIPTELYGLTFVEEVLSLPQDQQHRNYHTNYSLDNELPAGSFHRIRLKEGSLMAKLAGGAQMTPYIVTSHHQAVKKPGKGWIITATCMDGLIPEAMEHERFPNVIGIQFHPEVPRLYNNEHLKLLPNQSAGQSFFEMFPGEKGKDFHINFWKYIGDLYK